MNSYTSLTLERFLGDNKEVEVISILTSPELPPATATLLSLSTDPVVTEELPIFMLEGRDLA